MCRPPNKCHPTLLLTYCQTGHAGGCFSRHLQTVTSVTWAQCEPAFICEVHRAPLVNLPILVLSCKCQRTYKVLGLKHNPHLWMSSYHTILMESVSDRLSRHLHICGLLEVILQGFGSAPPTHPRTKAGRCPPLAFSTSPDGLACLLIVPPCSGHYNDRHSKPSCHSSLYCAIMDKMHYLNHLCGSYTPSWFHQSEWVSERGTTSNQNIDQKAGTEKWSVVSTCRTTPLLGV